MRVSVCVHRHLFFQRLLFRPAINLNRNAKADLNNLFRYRFTFSVAVPRSQPSSPEKGLPSLWWLFDCRNTATQSQKKPRKMAFFAPLGCLELHEINTNALRLFAHFFRRKPTGFCLKNELYFLASFQKNRAQNES
jgi:hypothetical protein